MWTAPLASSASCRKAQSSQTGRKARFFFVRALNPPKTSYGVSLPGVIGCASAHRRGNICFLSMVRRGAPYGAATLYLWVGIFFRTVVRFAEEGTQIANSPWRPFFTRKTRRSQPFLSSVCTKRFIKITQNHILQNQSSDNHAAKQTFSLTTLRFS